MSRLPAYLIVARIVGPFGIRGELKADLMTDFPERLAHRTTVYLGREDEEPRAYGLRGIRFHQGQALLRLQGCDDRTTAESLRGLFVQVPSADVPRLPEGSYYLYEIIGLAARSLDGRTLGTITEILSGAANDVYVATSEQGEILIPGLFPFVREIDLEQGYLIVDDSAL